MPADPISADVLSDPSLKRADLHCHSRFSIFKYFRRANTRDCYNAPEDVYRIAKERGMAYVTLTDHDSIDGALYLLNKQPDLKDFFIGEEVETYFPETAQRIHAGVWGLNEAQDPEAAPQHPRARSLLEIGAAALWRESPLSELPDEECRRTLHRRTHRDVRRL
jgi:predicted metal-dependent phosphoesterase TrpH